MKDKTFQGLRLFSLTFQVLEKKQNIKELSRPVETLIPGQWGTGVVEPMKASNDSSPSRVTADADVEISVYPMV